MENNNYPIAIPTMGRPEVTTIKNLGLDPRNVYLFVNDKSEYRIYKRANPKCNVVNTKSSGIARARNWILEYFNGLPVVMCDDDIKGIFKLNPFGKERKDKLVKLNPKEVQQLIKIGFKACNEYNTKLWGVYPIKNHFFMSPKIKPAGFIIGTFSGVIADPKNINFDEAMPLKEDYDFTCKHVAMYKKVIRFDNHCVEAVHYNNKGGCQNYRNHDKELKACEILLERYPQWVKLNTKRPGEVLLKFKLKG